MLTTLAIIAAIAIAGVLIITMLQPGTFQVQRSIAIDSTADNIFPLINSLNHMNSWSPFIKEDPAINGSYSGPDAGPGAMYAWRGSMAVGQGNIRIVDSQAPTHVVLQLNMLKPVAGQNRVEFTLQPDGTTTRVTWGMSGRQTFAGKLMNVLFNGEKMCGSQFEKGLQDLKLMAETAARGA